MPVKVGSKIPSPSIRKALTKLKAALKNFTSPNRPFEAVGMVNRENGDACVYRFFRAL